MKLEERINMYVCMYEMPVLPYSKHKNKYCGRVSTILSLKTGAYFIISSADDSLFLTGPRFMFKYAKWMVEIALCQDHRAPSN
jgi:hypothetical protein